MGWNRTLTCVCNLSVGPEYAWWWDISANFDKHGGLNNRVVGGKIFKNQSFMATRLF